MPSIPPETTNPESLPPISCGSAFIPHTHRHTNRGSWGLRLPACAEAVPPSYRVECGQTNYKSAELNSSFNRNRHPAWARPQIKHSEAGCLCSFLQWPRAHALLMAKFVHGRWIASVRRRSWIGRAALSHCKMSPVV